MWKQFSTNQPLDLVREFGKNIKVIGDKFNINILTKYGNNLIQAANSFDIESLLKLLNQYPQMVENFRSGNNNSHY